MNILYGETEKITQEFSYKINSGGELYLKVSNGSDRQVVITFVNNKFVSAEFNIADGFIGTRGYWHVMGAISKTISVLEEMINAPKAGQSTNPLPVEG